MLSTLWSDDVQLFTSNATAKAAPQLAGVLARFRRDATKLFNLVIHPSQHHLVQVAHKGSNRLLAIGVSNRVPHIQMLPCLHSDIHMELTIAMLNITTKPAARIIKAIRKKQAVMVKRKTLNGHGSIKWQEHLEHAKHLCHQHHSHEHLCAHATPSSSSIQSPLMAGQAITSFACPQGHTRAAHSPVFDALRPTKFSWCPGCKKYIAGKKWTCPCKVPWAQCPHHVSLITPAAAPCRKRSVVIQPMSADEAQRKKARIEPTGMATRLILPPSSAGRFPHLAVSPTCLGNRSSPTLVAEVSTPHSPRVGLR